MDISSLVRAVIAAFDDATKLVQRIRDQRTNSDGMQLPEEATRDLLESLALGPIIVRGHYEHDLKRFGEPYACGDIQAREQLKDVLITLQMSLIITLRTVYMDGIELDFLALQAASDDCRVNAGVCLGQLSQRLSDAMRAQAFYPQTLSYSSAPGLLPPLSPSLGYSSSRSTHSSAAFPAPRTPDPVAEQFGQLCISPSFRQPFEERKTSISSGGSQEQYLHPQSTTAHRPAAGFHVNIPSVGVHRIDEADDRSLRRRSSQALASDDNILLMFPQPGGQPVVPPPASTQDIHRESYISTGKNSHTPSSPDLSRASSGHQSQGSRDRFGPDDYGDHINREDGRQFSNGTIYDMYQPTSPERQASTSYSSRAQASNHSSFEYVRYLQENSRPPRREPRSDSLGVATRVDREIPRRPVRSQADTTTLSREFHSRPSVSAPIPIEPARTPPPSGPLPPPPVQSHPQSVAPKHPLPPPGRAPSVRTMASSTAPSVTPLINTGPVVLPTDKNLLGFCKGAFRLQAGMERKAFTIANRPHGLSGMTAYWRCEKCNFEGPVHNTVNTSDDKKKKGKPERVFDPRIRISEGGGIRYRWAFLARCHVSLKGMAPIDTPSGRDGSFGSFGCIFCCAEGKSRGWIDLSRTASNVAGSIAGSNGSIKSGHGSINPTKVNGAAQVTTPIFGNVSSFMQHLESVHRQQDGWPNAEMVGRFRVVVGRMAPVEEPGWEVNFVPF
ncbi:uncharacterized protein PV07_03816 [Cladophialophora immunda]|uniref:Uncharacterized protein n=1 Tax=Cladophialophora immunda TaxID=569365 RepID=A0A0D1ZVN6_9EURO|nr:uncharacterized protein PV07_03816 [Cladophialophora immunda]KIW32256.1 hypothetical protein PV07_03816 [Cladophialophora immunda]